MPTPLDGLESVSPKLNHHQLVQSDNPIDFFFGNTLSRWLLSRFHIGHPVIIHTTLPGLS